MEQGSDPFKRNIRPPAPIYARMYNISCVRGKTPAAVMAKRIATVTADRIIKSAPTVN